MSNISKEEFEQRLKQLRQCKKTRCIDGYWNYEQYSHGVANGLIIALAIMEGKQPELLVWDHLRDRA